MFFVRLRTHAKWVFAVLALVFAITFVAFGVGTGGPGIDWGGIFGGDSGTVTLESARKKVEENPQDREAVIQLATLLQRDGRYAEATEVLVDYTALRPNDAEGLRLLGQSYETQANAELQRAASQQVGDPIGRFASTLYAFPESSGFFGAVGQNPFFDALVGTGFAAASQAESSARSFYAQAADVYERITKDDPTNADAFFDLGRAASQEGDSKRAIAAYEQYLVLAPDGASASVAKDAVEQLKALAGAAEGIDTNQGVEQTG